MWDCLVFYCEDMMKEVCKREKEQGIIPDPDVDIYMKVNFYFI